MQIGMIGLGRMGMNMARRLLKGGIDVVALNRSSKRTDQFVQEGGRGAYSYEELTAMLDAPRFVWTMLPAGKPTDMAMAALKEHLGPGDTVVDGGNSRYKDDIRRFEEFKAKNIRYLDAGVSGGIWGLELGYCLMVGGEPDHYAALEPALTALAPKDGCIHCGAAGAGHFVKMIHNGIEYGMMQAYAEGFALIEDSDYGPGLDYANLAEVWNRGSVIRSWLLELAGDAFAKDRRLESLEGWVDDSGEGRWTVEQAVETGTPAPVLTMALMERFASRRPDDFRNRILAALRQEFGGHAVKGKD